MEVRTRFAPSPTGYLHIGGLRTALYGWLFARQNNGKFILRIEDTDQDRYVEGAVELIYDTMKQTGLTYDEGPDVGGEYGPYIQSERRALYREYADLLVEKGGAYYCFCTKEQLNEQRKSAEEKGEAYRYNGTCASLSLDEAKARIEDGEAFVVRQRIPKEGEASFDDMVFGKISVDVKELEEGVLLKTDGMPTYNFANVVDDNLMKISHIIRGTEYLSSTPKYNLIYQSFGWDIPKYMHLSPVMRDAQHKLSKRDGDASYEDFINKGYLKEAILNYISLLGWSPGTTQEIFSLEELVAAFSVEGISKSPGIFDENKLRWMNGEYIRAMDEDAFTKAALPYYEEVIDATQFDLSILCNILQPRTEIFTEIPEKIAFLSALPDYDIALFEHKKMKTDTAIAKAVLPKVKEALENITPFEHKAIYEALVAVAKELELKNGQVLWTARVALTGTPVTPGGAIEAALLLKKEESLRRIDVAIEKLNA